MNSKSQNEAPRTAIAPSYIQYDLERLEHCFNASQSKYPAILDELFARQANVYTYALDLVYYSKDFMKGKTCSLPQVIIEFLREWCLKHDTSNLTLDVKYLSVNRVLQQPSGAFVKLVCDVFKVKEDYNYFKFLIKSILKEYKFKEAYYLISSLDAENDFTLEEFVFPVFFLDKESWIKRFLDKVCHLRIPFVQKLDSICQSSMDIKDFIRTLPYENLPLRKHAYDNIRLQKLLANYIEYFDLDIKQCKNLYHVRCANAMSYVVRKRYSEESISKEAFEEIIKFIVADHKILQKELLSKLVWCQDYTTALKFAVDFNLNKNEWPELLQNSSVPNREEDVYISANYSVYLTLRLDRSDVLFIDTPEKCIKAIDDIAENYDVVGIDAEWRPNLGINKEKLSLYQIAVWDSVYLIDVLTLKNYSDQKFWSYFFEKIFNNKNIIKLGYGFKNDLALLLSLCSKDKAELSKLPRILDLCEFFKKVGTAYPKIIEAIDQTQQPDVSFYLPTKGLSQLCYTILGKPLNKEEQFSDWERRPLRESQIIYAALDAYSLLLMYEKLFHISKDLQLNFDDVMKNTSTSPTKKENIKKNNEKEKVMKKSDFKPIHASQFKVVVDNMIHGLGKYLRMCGADVVHLDNDDNHMEAVKISQAENRIILSAGTPYQKLSGYVHEDMCYCVSVGVNAREQAIEVLEHFNVQCKSTDIFSRCSICSGNDFKKVPKCELYPLWSALTNLTDGNKDTLDEVKHTFAKTEQFLSEDGILQSGVPIQISALSARVFETVEIFFICVNCGKVYWEGSHFTRTKKMLSKVITQKEDYESNIYKGPAVENSCSNLANKIESEMKGKPPIPRNLTGESSIKKSTSFDVQPEANDQQLSTNQTSLSRPRLYMSFDVDTSSDEDDYDLVHC